MVLKNEWVNNEIKGKSESFWKHMKMNTTVQKLWDTANVKLRGKFIAIQAYLKERKISNKLCNLQLHKLEKQQQTKPRARRRKELMKITAELNDIETKNK